MRLSIISVYQQNCVACIQINLVLACTCSLIFDSSCTSVRATAHKWRYEERWGRGGEGRGTGTGRELLGHRRILHLIEPVLARRRGDEAARRQIASRAPLPQLMPVEKDTALGQLARNKPIGIDIN